MAAKKKVEAQTKSSVSIKQSPRKKKVENKSATKNKEQRTASSRPTYQQMVTECLSALDPRKSATRAKLVQNIKEKYGVDSKVLNSRLRIAVKTLLDENIITLAKGTGYSNGHFRLTTRGKTRKVRSESPAEEKKVETAVKERARSQHRSKTTVQDTKRTRSLSKTAMKSEKAPHGEKRKSRSPVKTTKKTRRSKTNEEKSKVEAKTKKTSAKSSSPAKKNQKAPPSKTKRSKN